MGLLKSSIQKRSRFSLGILQIALLVPILIWRCNSTNKEPVKVPADDIKQATIAFAELKEALNNEGGRLWNHKLDGPVLLVNRDTRTIIANEKDEKGELTNLGDFYTGRWPENINIANTATDWNGKRWTMVAFPLPELKEERLRLLIHESFHRIQPEIGFDSIEEEHNNHLDTKEGRVFMKLEMEALKQALDSDNPEKHIKNALMFRHYRHQLFPGSEDSENSLEINEGIAEYTGSILCGLNNSEMKKQYSSSIDLFYSIPTFVRSFAYFTIPVYGYFMKQIDEKWNLNISNKTNLTGYISGFFNVPNLKSDINEITRIAKSYNINSINEFEKDREFRRLERIKKYKGLFLGDSIVKIRLEKMDIGFNPGNQMPLDSFGTVYPNLIINDNWGILRVDSLGALVSPDWKYVTISYPEIINDTLIRGKGWKLKLNESWKLEKENMKFMIKKN